ncbi:unnamed protein product [Rhodiola kirilowii]
MSGCGAQRIFDDETGGAEYSLKQEQRDSTTEPLDSDCNGTADDRRLLRSRYLALKTHIHDNKNEILSTGDLDAFTSVINKVDNLHQLVQKPREQVADAEALLDISNNLVTSVKSQANEGLTPSDFIARLLMQYGLHNGAVSDMEQNALRWDDVGRAVGHIFRHCRGHSTMLGPMAAELKKRKLAAQRQRSKPTESSQPEALDDKREEEQTDTDNNMLIMFGMLRRRKRVQLESLILNRHSFAQTVENMFALSFLVKDGRVEITVNEKGSHFVSPKNAPSASLVTSGDVRYSHFVFRLDFKDWKLMMDMVPVGEELMPHRISSTSTDEQFMQMRHSASQPPCSTSRIQDDPSLSLDPTADENLVVEDSPERDADSQPSRIRLSGFRKMKRKQLYNSCTQ